MVDLQQFFSNLGIVGGNELADNQYDFFKGIEWDDGTITNTQYEFFRQAGSDNRRKFFRDQTAYNNETAFYENIDDNRIYNYKTFYQYAGEYLIPPTPFQTYQNAINNLANGSVIDNVVCSESSIDAYTTSSVMIPQGGGYTASNLYGYDVPNTNLVDFDVVRATSATRVNSSGLIEEVGNNVARWDYLNGTASCPELLIEPQRTNLEANSQDITAANYFNLNLTFTNNATTAPDSTLTADQVTVTSTGSVQLSNTYTVSGSTDYVCSLFIKKQSGATDLNRIRVTQNGTGTTIISRVDINLDTGVITELTGSGASSESYNDDWWRVIIPLTTDSSATALTFQPIEFGSQTAAESVYLWGVQVEQGSYATSYIPTAGTIVTRNVDEISASGIGSLLGDSEGGFFIEASVFESTFNGISVSDSTINNRFRVDTTTAGRFIIISSTGGTLQTNEVSVGGLYSINTFFKVAVGYAANDVNMYHNGSSIITDTTWAAMVGINKLELQDPSGGPFYGRIRQLVYFNERPTNTQLAALTT